MKEILQDGKEDIATCRERQKKCQEWGTNGHKHNHKTKKKKKLPGVGFEPTHSKILDYLYVMLENVFP